MAEITPFAALRPRPEYASKVAALPYDVMSTEEAHVMAEGNPHSFLRVDKAEIDLPPGTAFNDPAVYEKARANLQKLVTGNILFQDVSPYFYIYRLTAGGRMQLGLAACVNVSDYENGVIKKHELTRQDKERDRIDHIKACGAHTGPIFMAYRAEKTNESIRGLLNGWIADHKADYDFITKEDIRHELWVINKNDYIQNIIGAFTEVPCLYIADGHHRSAAAAKAGGSGVFLAVIFPHDELAILDYNRLVADLNGLDEALFLHTLKNDFTVTPVDKPVQPSQTHEYGLYINGKWYRLAYKNDPPTDMVEGLAVSVLQDKVLSPILGIQDPRTDRRIDFVGGIRGVSGLTGRVDSGEMAAAFTLCPTTLTELFDVSDMGRIMPPKSTWFEPKLLSGLLIHLH